MLGRRAKIALAIVLVLVVAGTLARRSLARWLVEIYTPQYEPPQADTSAPVLKAEDDGRGPQARTTKVVLEKVAEGLKHPTDVQFVPGSSQRVVVLEKAGKAVWLDLKKESRGVLLQVKVRTASEEGLLGLAFHPAFASNGRFFLHYTPGGDSIHRGRIAEWKHSSPGDFSVGKASETRVLLEVEQPYQNHNGGQIAFGPDGRLYIGFGDGGLANDPDGNGQDASTLLGAMLRIDVDGKDPGRGYAIPPDNPFLKRKGARPELWAIGLRNPWRFTFAPDGRLIVADVGQNLWEEIDIVRPGDNLGWVVREGFTCFKDHADCNKMFVEPIHTYGREVGTSLTGGHVYSGKAIPSLRGKYLFADFVSGRFFALKLPKKRTVPAGGLEAELLGKWPVLPSAFGIDAAGEVYVAAFGHGILYRFAADAEAGKP